MDVGASAGESRDDDTAVWIRGVDYVQAWAEARDAAEELNAAVVALGLRREDLWATAHTDDHGNGVVLLKARRRGFARRQRL